jgi:hypothetical protein
MASSTLEITIQRGNAGSWPVVVEDHRSGTLLPVRSEGRFRLASEPISSIPHNYGAALGKGLFKDSIRDAFVRARNESAASARVLLFVEAEELKSWRWEWLCGPLDGNRWDFLSLDQRALFSLYLPSLTDRAYPPIGRADLRALVVVASPADPDKRYGLEPFDIASNVARLQAIFGEQIPSEVMARVPGAAGGATLDELITRLTEGAYPILHVLCHGRFYSDDGETVLFLEQATADGHGAVALAQPVSGTELVKRLTPLKRLPYLVFLSACESSAPEAEQRLGGLAQRLVRELGIPAVIGMTEKVSVRTAHALAAAFYQRLLEQKKLGEVDRALVEAYAGLASRPDVNVPALYSRLGSQPLFSRAVDRVPSGLEIRLGLEKLDKLLTERAPVLRQKFENSAQKLRQTLDNDTDALSAMAKQEREQSLMELNELCQEAVEVSFNALAQGEPAPGYDARQPFRGMSPFRIEDREFFFGREALIRTLEKKLARHNFLAVLGSSGSGKSSLVLAGLVPRLTEKVPDLQVVNLTPGSLPLDQLRAHQTTHESGPVLYVVDQFEEVFTQCKDEAQRQQFIDELLKLTETTPVIMTMRADFWGECAPYAELKERMQARQELVPPMTAPELRAAMEQQAAKVGLRFEADLSNTMLDEVVGEPGAMPLLQHALLELWKRRHGRWLRAEEYRQLGGVKKAIAETADRLYGELTSAEQQRVRDIFLRLTQLDESVALAEQRRDTRRRVSISDLVPAGTEANETKALVKKLADAVLVVTSRNEVTGQEEVEVAHEALIGYWGKLRAWLDEDLANLRLRDSITEAAANWEGNDRKDDYLLLRGSPLVAAKTLYSGGRLDWSSLEVDYLKACEQRERDIALDPYLHNIEFGGWGIIFASPTSAEVRSALHELLALRQRQSARRFPGRYREFFGDSGVHESESAMDFLRRQGAGITAPDPAMPRFLLLVGGPDQIPFDFQYQLSINYDVGRLHFVEASDYEKYSQSVCRAETARPIVRHRVTIFSPQHKFDTATRLLGKVATLLAENLRTSHTEWEIDLIRGTDATKKVLQEQFDDAHPALLITLSHGMQLPPSAEQRAIQGAIVCSDWESLGKVAPEQYFAGSDLAPDVDTFGMISLNYGAFTAGTPRFTDYNRDSNSTRIELSATPFLADLPIQLLRHPRGSALAVIGIVDVGWMYSFEGVDLALLPTAKKQAMSDLYVHLELVRKILDGYPIGTAMRSLINRFTSLACIDRMLADDSLDPQHREQLRMAVIDARNYVLLGDPAVRLTV